MFGKGKMFSYALKRKEPGQDLHEAISEGLKKYPNTKEIIVRVDESEGLGDFGLPITHTYGIQPHHFVLVLNLKSNRRPVIFGGKRCPILK